MAGASTRFGTYKCYGCRKPFTVKIGTLFESSHVPMHKWLRAIYLLISSRQGVAPQQLCRILEVSPKTAVFMVERIARAAQSNDGKERSRKGVSWRSRVATEVRPE
jgi:transposase-like protein